MDTTRRTLLTTGAAVAAAAAAARAFGQTERSSPAGGKFFTKGDVRIHYSDSGSPGVPHARASRC